MVSAVDSNGVEGNKGGPASAKTLFDTMAIGVPAPSAKALSDKEIEISWSGVSGAQKYLIYRATAKAGAYAKIGETVSLKFVNNMLPADTEYHYMISAVVGGYEGGKGGPASARTEKSGPPAPDFWLRDYSGTGITLHWSYTPGAHYPRYGIYRSTSSSGPFAKIYTFVMGGNPVTGTVSYTSQSLVKGQTYYYRMTSIDSNGVEGPLSQTVRYWTVGTPESNQPGKG